jgi:7-carboxy-7-deazaguanine synthase
MSYAVKEIFYTLQGEGAQTGRAAVFLRFSGCNLWSGREEDRDRGTGGCSRWCDTDFVGFSATGGKFRSANELAARVAGEWPKSALGRRFVVCTGGEPLLQLDELLIDALHAHGFEVAIETNGTQHCPPGIDWVCVSPKSQTSLVLQMGDELKLVYPQPGLEPEVFETLPFSHFFLQPMDGLDRDLSTRLVTEYCLSHPKWRMSLQTHKYLGIP